MNNFKLDLHMFIYLAYFVCRDEMILRMKCPDKHLYDEYLHSCNEYRKVFCGNRPIDISSSDPCKLRMISISI